MKPNVIPQAFVWRRLHSFMGLWLTLYLILHLLTNSQAALFFGDDGHGFVEGVKSIHNLPYLPAIEIFLLGVPFAVHIFWGVKYLFTAAPNSMSTDGSTPALPEYSRNRAYTWQRITSWILLFAIIAHVIHMRFIEYPIISEVDGKKFFMVRLGVDKGLYTVADRLDVKLYDNAKIDQEERALVASEAAPRISMSWSLLSGPQSEPYNAAEGEELDRAQDARDHQHFVEALRRRPLDADQVIAVADNFGTASLLMVRETFKMPLMVALYSLFVIVACYHAFNGLWTFLITWGITLTPRSQVLALRLSIVLMILISFLGLAAAVGTYWVNLRY